MPGLSDLKIKIKNQPHGLAWINDKERSVLKAMGGSGKSGPMGIPAYYDDGQVDEVGYDPDIGPPPDDPNEGEERVGPVQKGYSTISYDTDKGWDFNYEGRPHDLYEPGPFEKGPNKTIEDISIRVCSRHSFNTYLVYIFFSKWATHTKCFIRKSFQLT